MTKPEDPKPADDLTQDPLLRPAPMVEGFKVLEPWPRTPRVSSSFVVSQREDRGIRICHELGDALEVPKQQ